ncbi:hypothetical protein N7537_011066 [Penicillium hordei]|uniref:Uncharacterized protein n=1 Tax=Penicillium hordei TaxID=40994 RepID=A0AAD6GSE6_9EURO|nr:uncharacterized protein N7537_011066 [Penicillium hordei]KAJ5588388.1 hypothetical protein N7537_011066 [Penicillium hordei]
MTTDTEEVLSNELIRLRISTGASGPALHSQKILEPIASTHSFFDRAKELHQKHDWLEERFENF